jgi:arginine exporter protein ArgO
MTPVAAEMASGSHRVTLYIAAILTLCALTVICVLGITFLRPAADNLSLIAVVVGVFTPIVTALLAAALKENHDAMNSRLTQLLELTKTSAHAEGKLEK